MRIRRNALAGLVLVLLAVNAVALWLLLPGIVGQQIAAKAEEKTGLPTRVEDVRLGMSSVSVGELVVGGERGELAIRVSQIEVGGSPLSLALGGSRAITALSVGALDARVPLQAASTRTLIAKLTSRGESSGQSSGGSTSLASVAVGRVSVLVSDQHGELARVDNGRATLQEGKLHLEADRAGAGQELGGRIDLQRVSADAVRGTAGFRLAKAEVRDAHVWLPALPVEGQTDQPRPVPRTVQRLLQALPGSSSSGSAAGSDAHSSAAIPAHANARWDEPQTAPPAAITGAGPLPASVMRLLERLADDAVLTLDTSTIYGPTGGTPIMQKLGASLRVQPGQDLRFSGHGVAQGNGGLRWDLAVKPEALRADGDVVLKTLPLNLIAAALPSIPWYQPEKARIDATLNIKTTPEGISFSGQGSLRDAAIDSARIAPTPVTGIDVDVQGSGRLIPMRHRLEISEGEFALSRAKLRAQGAIEWSSDHFLFNIDANLPPTDCTEVVQSVPEDMLGDMALASWKGKLGGQLKLRLDSRQLEDTELSMKVQDHCQFETVPVLADLRRFGKPFIQSVIEPDDTVFEMETGPGTSNWTDIEDISPYLVHAILAHEDAGFFSHKGFSMRHIRDAVVRNLQERRYVVGASTITMQLVKNVFLHREKTLARKIQEVLLTWWLERVMPKRDILELYLNVIEYGPQIYGIRNASMHYFSRPPSELSPAESVWLANILPNPKHFHAQLSRGSISNSWAEMMRKMMIRLRDRGSYSEEAYAYGMAELEHFHFAPEGTHVAPREIPGGAAPLPYMKGASADDARWQTDEANIGGGDLDDSPDPMRPNQVKPAPILQ